MKTTKLITLTKEDWLFGIIGSGIVILIIQVITS